MAGPGRGPGGGPLPGPYRTGPSRLGAVSGPLGPGSQRARVCLVPTGARAIAAKCPPSAATAPPFLTPNLDADDAGRAAGGRGLCPALLSKLRRQDQHLTRRPPRGPRRPPPPRPRIPARHVGPALASPPVEYTSHPPPRPPPPVPRPLLPACLAAPDPLSEAPFPAPATARREANRRRRASAAGRRPAAGRQTPGLRAEGRWAAPTSASPPAGGEPAGRHGDLLEAGLCPPQQLPRAFSADG